MQRRRLGRTGLQVSALGFGSGPIGLLAIDRSRAARVLNLLLDAGINIIDTAAAYKGSEAVIGEAIGHRRDEYVLVSKCGRPDDDIQGEPWSADLIARTIDRALRRLRTDHLDVMLLHSCELETLKEGTALAALTGAQQAGKVRWVGYSGDNEAASWAVGESAIAVLETSVNPFDQANIETALPGARAHGVGVIAKRPIGNSAWKELLPGLYQDYAQIYRDRFRQMKLMPASLGVSGDVEKAWTELALRFTLSQPDVHTAIVGTTDPQHAVENVAFAEKGPLQPEAAERVRTAFREAERASGEHWPAQR